MKNSLLTTFISLMVLVNIHTAAYSRIKTGDLLSKKNQYPNSHNIRTLKEAFDVRWVPGGSMEPTLHGTPNTWEADVILIDKFIYRFQLPLRGDIVVFEPTDELLRQQFNNVFIKRIIALPGEKVQLKNGKVYINNKLLQENNYTSQKERTAIDICVSQSQAPYLSKPQTIPPNSYLVLGDHRQHSYDSRCWGVVPKKNILGQVVKRVWPLEKKRDFGQTRSSQQHNSEELFIKNVGFLVYPYNNLSSAISYLEKNLAIAQKNKNIINQIILLRHLITYNALKKETNKAIDYSQQFLGIARKNKILGAETQALALLSLGYLANNNFDYSINFGQQALSIARKNQDYQNEYLALYALTIANVSKKHCNKANDFYKQSLNVLAKIDKREKEMLELQQLFSSILKSLSKACLPLN